MASRSDDGADSSSVSSVRSRARSVASRASARNVPTAESAAKGVNPDLATGRFTQLRQPDFGRREPAARLLEPRNALLEQRERAVQIELLGFERSDDGLEALEVRLERARRRFARLV